MQIGKYTLGRLIGQGGAGSVYQSQHPLLAQPVAIKLMHTNDAAARAEFLREAQTVAALSHPHIVNILDVDEHQGQPFLVMELIEQSLADRLQQGMLSLTEAAGFLLPLLDGLGYAHKQGVIHCDLKPANVLLRANQVAVLADFGLALQARTQAGVLVGTPEYMAPEQIRNEALDVRTDLYAFGAMFYEVLTGRTPFVGDVASVVRGHLHEIPAPPSRHNSALNPEVDALVLGLLAKAAADRPQTTMEVAARLRKLAGQATTVPRVAASQAQQPMPPKVVPAANARPRRLVIGLFAGVLVLLVVSLILIGTLARPADSLGPAADTGPLASDATPVPTQRLDALPMRQLARAPMANAALASNTEDFELAGITWEDNPSSILFVGELRNLSGESREDIRIRIELLNATGGVLAEADGVIQQGYLAAGETGVFLLYFHDEAVPNVAFSDYRVSVVSKPLSDFTREYVIKDSLLARVEEVGSSRFGNNPVVRGLLINNHTTAVRFPEVTAVFYNEAGQVIGVTDVYGQTLGDQNLLEAGSSVPFETLLVSLTERNVASFLLYVEGNRP
jgi:hypothetical protein